MNGAPPNYRKERIERLFEELRYEVTRGMLENEIGEQIGFSFMVPRSRTYPSHGVVWCQFTTHPVENAGLVGASGPRLRVVSPDR